MVKSWLPFALPSRSLAKTILSPCRDHAGELSVPLVRWVICVGSVPSGFDGPDVRRAVLQRVERDQRTVRRPRRIERFEGTRRDVGQLRCRRAASCRCSCGTRSSLQVTSAAARWLPSGDQDRPPIPGVQSEHVAHVRAVLADRVDGIGARDVNARRCPSKDHAGCSALPMLVSRVDDSRRWDRPSRCRRVHDRRQPVCTRSA